MGASAAMTAGAGIGQAYGDYQAGKYADRVASFNARVAEIQAKDAIRRGGETEGRLRKDARRLIGAQRAGYAGQGVIVDRDTAGAVVDETRTVTEQDAQTIRTNAMLEAWGFRVQAASARAEGDQARLAGRNRAIGTILTSGSQAYAYHNEWQKAQPTPAPRTY